MRAIGDWYRGEAEKLRAMTWPKKLQYLFVYYKGWFAGFLILLLFASYAVDVVVQGQKETALQGFFTNDVYSAFPVGEIEKDLTARLGLGRDQKILFDDDLYIDLGGEATEYSAASNGKIIAYMAVGELDFVVTTGEVYRHFAGDVPMKNLRDFLPEDLYQRLSPCIVDAPDQHGEPVPSAIELSQCRFLRDRDDLPPGTFYLFIPHSAPRETAILEFIRYLFEGGPEAGSLPAAVTSAPEPEPALPEKKPLSLARELPDTGEPVELTPEEWEIPPNPHYADGECTERVWWVHGKVLRVPWAEGYQSRPDDPVQLLELTPEERLQLREKHPELAMEGLTFSLLCDEKGDLLYPRPFHNIYLREDYISLTGLEYTWLIDYDGSETDTLRLPITKAYSMDRLPDGNYLGYLGELVITYDREGNEIARDSTAYQQKLPNGAVLDARWEVRSLANNSLVPFLRDHPDPEVERRINGELETFFKDDWSEEYFSEFSADCTGKVLHIRQMARGKSYKAVASMQAFSNLHLDLETGEVYRPGDLFADETGARQYIRKKILEEGDGDWSDEFLSRRLDGFVERHSLNFGVTGDNLYYEIWDYLVYPNPLEIPLAEFGDCLDREGRFYRALTGSF